MIYEAHVKGLTMTRPIPEEIRGTYAAIGHPVIVDHLTNLGVTAIELMPRSNQFVQDTSLRAKGLTNYWGYNTIGFLPHNAYAAGSQGSAGPEFKTMVKALHEAGIEVILDVVYNHTAEGQRDGPPTLCFGVWTMRPYYRLVDGARSTTTTRPAPGTACSCAIPMCCSSSWIHCATGSPRCTSTGSLRPRRHPGRQFHEVTSSAASSTSSSRTR